MQAEIGIRYILSAFPFRRDEISLWSLRETLKRVHRVGSMSREGKQANPMWCSIHSLNMLRPYRYHDQEYGIKFDWQEEQGTSSRENSRRTVLVVGR